MRMRPLAAVAGDRSVGQRHEMKQEATQSQMDQHQIQLTVRAELPDVESAVDENQRGGRHADHDDGGVDIGFGAQRAHDRHQSRLECQKQQPGGCQSRHLMPPPMPSENVLNAASVPIAMIRPFHRSRIVSS